MPHYARKVDTTQQAIVTALRACGWEVHVIEEPVDLLCIKGGRKELLEVKTPTKSGRIPKRRDQQEQNEFCERTNTPRVATPSQALEALGECLTYFGEK
jgi:hypothetical protein